MAGCGCVGDKLQFEGLSQNYKKILWIIIGINAVMFFVETYGSVAADSMALRADALDFLGDSITYTITLIAIGRSSTWRASAAMLKGISLMLMGLWVLFSTIYRVFVLGVPNEMLMGGVALLAFVANLTSALLLMKYRNGDANVRSVWLCSRNDAISNLAVMVAAVVVGMTMSPWPDLIVAGLMAGLFLQSAFLIIRQAKQELQEVNAAT